MQALKSELKERSQSDVARAAGISVQLMCDILAGRRRYSPKLLKYLGFKKVVVYQRIGK